MPYCQLHFHLIWATNNRAPIITDAVWEVLNTEIRRKAGELRATVHAVGGIEDHIHVVASLPPTVAVSTFVGQIKGVTSFKINRVVRGSAFAWQAEYGAFSIRRQELGSVVRYVLNQEIHHRGGDLLEELERC